MPNPSCACKAAWSARPSNKGKFLPHWWPYIEGCKKKHIKNCVCDNEFGVDIYAHPYLKDGSGDVRHQRKEFT